MTSKHMSLPALAIIGLGCRFPGPADSPRGFWRLLEQGMDATGPVPASRWDARRFSHPDQRLPGRAHSARGAFLAQDIECFDAQAFGIAPREAARMDPMQRLLLEVATETFEDAGIPAETLAGSATAVVVGGFCTDNLLQLFDPRVRELVDSHTPANTTLTMLANRLSYQWDLRGPSLSLDTACSSSLMAMHLACRAIWSGEAELALAGGANVMLRPEYFIAMSKGRFLSPEGRCFTWDARASGYGRGEGAGLVLVKPLSRALADGDRVRAVVRASGANHDGRTVGISLPNPEAQAALLRRVYTEAGIQPAELHYVEAHGTGTQAGDTAELSALDAVLGAGRPVERPLLVGSVKSAIGHLEAAAGVAGLIKTVLALEARRLPANLHFQTPNPAIPFERLRLRVVDRMTPLPAAPAELLAGVNSFGYGGANAHVVLASPPTPAEPTPARARLFPLSARRPDQLAELAGRWAFRLAGGAGELQDVVHTAACRRSGLRQRAVFPVGTAQALREALQAFSTGESPVGLVRGEVPADGPPRAVWVYTGMGPQHWGMARDLCAREPAAAEALARFDAAFAPVAGWSMAAALGEAGSAAALARTAQAQPANFAVQYILTELLRGWGLEADAVVGHSVGEVAASWACGALSLEQAVLVSIHRSRLQQDLAGSGGMLAAGISEARAAELIADRPAVAIAAINAPESVTLSGPEAELATIGAQLEAEGLFQRALQVELPYHGPVMERIRAPLTEALAELRPVAERIPFYSTVTGARLAGVELGADYWWLNVRQTVRFADALAALLAEGHGLALQIGPHPVLRQALRDAARTAGKSLLDLGTLDRRQTSAEPEALLAAVAGLWCAGLAPDWRALNGPGRCVAAPGQPWRRERHWAEDEGQREDRLGRPGAPPLLDRRIDGPVEAFEVEIDDQRFPFLPDHLVQGRVVFPGAGYVEALLEMARQRSPGEGPLELRDLRFLAPLVIAPGEAPVLAVGPVESDGRCPIHARRRGLDRAWRRHVDGRLLPVACALSGAEQPAPGAEAEILAAPRFYEELAARGLSYGPAFRQVQAALRDGDLVEVTLEAFAEDGYLLSPALLDAAFQAVLAATPGRAAYVPVSIGRLVWHARPQGSLRARIRVTWRGARAIGADLSLADAAGRLLVELYGLYCQALDLAHEDAAEPVALLGRWLAEEAPSAEPPPQPPAQVLIEAQPEAETLAAVLATLGSCQVLPGDGLAPALDQILAAPCPQLVLVLAPTAAAGDAEPDWDRLIARAGLCSLLAARPPGRCDLVLRGALAGPGEAGDPAAAALAEAAALLPAECAGLELRLIDLAPGLEPQRLLAELRLPGPVDQVLLRPEARLVWRLELQPPPPPPRAALAEGLQLRPDPQDGAWRWWRCPPVAPGPGQLRLRLAQVLLEDRDRRCLQGQAGARPEAERLGLLGWGRVEALAPGLAGPAVGELVLALGPGLLASHAVLPVERVLPCRRPPDLVALRRAWWTCLAWDLAGVAPRRVRLLGGDAQLAALCRGLGAEVVAADEPADVLLQFAAEPGPSPLLAPTALAVDCCGAGLEDLGVNRRGLRLDAEALCRDDPSRALAALARALALVENPAGPGLPATSLHEAARQDAPVIALDDNDSLPCADGGLPIATPDQCWLVTGGTGGFGAALAIWLASQGAGRIAIASRRGAAAPEAAATAAAIRAAGAEVLVLALDVADPAAVEACVAELSVGARPLAGVVHAAMVLDDGLLADLTPERWRRALAAKAIGAWNLHQATRALPLAGFVLCSSVAALLGNPGQGGYILANALLDALAVLRRARGLPALSLAWGALAGGVVGRDPALRELLTRQGLPPLPVERALAACAAWWRSGAPPRLGLIGFDAARWTAANPALAGRARALALRHDEACADGTRDRLRRLPVAERRAATVAVVRGHIAAVLGLEPVAVEPDAGIVALGVDSLMAIELGLLLRQDLGVALGPMDLLRGPSAAQLAELVVIGDDP